MYFDLTHKTHYTLCIFTGGNAWVEWTHSLYGWYASGRPLSDSETVAFR